MQQFSLVYNNLFVFLEPVDELRPTYACGQLMQGSSIYSVVYIQIYMIQIVLIHTMYVKLKVTSEEALGISCVFPLPGLGVRVRFP